MPPRIRICKPFAVRAALAPFSQPCEMHDFPRYNSRRCCCRCRQRATIHWFVPILPNRLFYLKKKWPHAFCRGMVSCCCIQHDKRILEEVRRRSKTCLGGRCGLDVLVSVLCIAEIDQAVDRILMRHRNWKVNQDAQTYPTVNEPLQWCMRVLSTMPQSWLLNTFHSGRTVMPFKLVSSPPNQMNILTKMSV